MPVSSMSCSCITDLTCALHTHCGTCLHHDVNLSNVHGAASSQQGGLESAAWRVDAKAICNWFSLSPCRHR